MKKYDWEEKLAELEKQSKANMQKRLNNTAKIFKEALEESGDKELAKSIDGIIVEDDETNGSE